jgi:PTS system fructose-specific IIC component
MKNIRKSLMTGVSYMLPFIVVAGLVIGLTGILTTYLKVESEALTALNGFAWTIMGLIPAIFGAYCAYAIGDKPAICAGFLGGYIASFPIFESTSPSGFLGGLIAGLIAGYLVNLLKKVRFPDVIVSLKSTIFIPLVSVLIIYFVMAYPIGYAVGWLNDTIVNGLLSMAENPALSMLLGAVLSAMCAFDMGGPLGKIAITFVFAVWSDPSGLGFMVNAAVFPGIMVPALAVGLASLIVPGKFTSSERRSAPSALVTGLVGITEAALPFAFRDPVRVIGSNVIGAAVGGALMMGLKLQTPGVSGLIGVPAANNPVLFLLSIAAGVAVSTILLIIVKKPVVDEDKVEEEELELEITF